MTKKREAEQRHRPGLTYMICAGLLAAALLPLLPQVTVAQSWNPGREQNIHNIPSWARIGKIRFGLWYGGILDLAKGILSNWDFYYPSDPDMIEASCHWYDPQTVKYLRAMHIDWIWVTWSNGFSIPQEKIQWQKLRPFIADCHQQGIHVTAYMSISNIFRQEMFKDEPQSVNWVLKDANGRPREYGINSNRYMADINNPAWQNYLKKRIDAALAAGVDGLMYDNTLGFYGRETAQRLASMMLRYAQKKKPDVLFCSNYNRGQLTWARAQNMITTEDGSEAGLYETDPLPGTPYTYNADGRRSFAKFGSYGVSINGRESWLVNNAGLARYLMGISGGWRPIIIEEGAWNGANRMTAILPPHQYKLAIAESASFGFGFEIQFLGAFQRDLYFRRPQAMRSAEAIGQYNNFLAKNENLFTGPDSRAQIAMLCDDTDNEIGLLNYLAGQNLIFDVLFSRTLSADQLAHYRMVVLANTYRLSDQSIALVRAYVRSGGTLLILGKSATENENGEKRARPGFADLLDEKCGKLGQRVCHMVLGRGSVFYSTHNTNEDIYSCILPRIKNQTVYVQGPPYVICNLVRQPQQNRSVLYLLNYSKWPVRGLQVRIQGSYSNVELFSPDKVSTQVQMRPERPGHVEVMVPELKIYDVLTLE